MHQDQKSDPVNLTVSEKLLHNFISQQKSSRRWSVLFRLLFFIWLFVFTGMLFDWFGDISLLFTGTDKSSYTAVIHIDGIIDKNENANAENAIENLRKASEDEKAKAIILAIDSPGGSPVQAGQIYDEIMRLRKKYPKKHIYSVIGDLGASGAYYVAAASDKIYANRASVIGSIGAYILGYDATALAQKLGISRRIYKAGKNKLFMDPLVPDTAESIKNAEEKLSEIHQQFIDCVKKGRGKRLKIHHPGLFSGLTWTGESALKIGLIDGLGDVNYVAEEIIGEKNLIDFSTRPNTIRDVFQQLSLTAWNTVKSSLKTYLSS